LLTVRGATLQILATSPVVRTSFTLAVVLIAFSPSARGLRLFSTAYVRFVTANIVEAVESFRELAPILRDRREERVMPVLADERKRTHNTQVLHVR
jgi:hypothetical protein